AYRVDSAGDEGDAAPGDATCGTLAAACTLRAAVQEANARAGDDLILVPAAFGPYVLTEPGPSENAGATGDLDVLSSGRLTIRGEGTGRPVIDAAGLDRVFDVLDDAALTLEGLTLTGGAAPSEEGGAIRTGFNSSLTVNRCEIEGNSASSGGGVAGGPGAVVEIVDSTIADNLASSAGGGISILAASLTLGGSTVENNQAPAGGGLSITKSVFAVSNSTVSSNQTLGPGSAAIDGGEGGSSLVSATVTANVGGGIAAGAAVIEIGNSIVAANGVDLRGAF